MPLLHISSTTIVRSRFYRSSTNTVLDSVYDLARISTIRTSQFVSIRVGTFKAARLSSQSTAKVPSSVNRDEIPVGLSMGKGHSRSQLRLEESGKKNGRIGFCLADGLAALDAAVASGFSLVNGRGRYGAKPGICDLRRADGNVDW